MDTFQLNILAASSAFYEGECESLVVPTSDGKRGVLAHHSNAIAAISPGELSYTVPGEKPRLAAVSHGMIKIEDNHVLVLVETAEKPEDIDRIRNQQKADAARQAPFGESGLIVSAEAEMLRLFLCSQIHAKYRKPIDMVVNIVYDDVVGFEQTRSKEVAQDAEPELSERTVRQSNATLPDKAVWSGASFCVPLSRSISSLTSTICPGVCEEQAPVIFWSNPQFLKTYRYKST